MPLGEAWLTVGMKLATFWQIFFSLVNYSGSDLIVSFFGSTLNQLTELDGEDLTSLFFPSLSKNH